MNRQQTTELKFQTISDLRCYDDKNTLRHYMQGSSWMGLDIPSALKIRNI